MLPFIDLKAQFEIVGNDINKRVLEVLASTQYIMGPPVKEMEAELAIFTDVKHCISCASGTDALLMALMALEIGPGDAVLTTPFTFVATAEVIALTGATPVFVDIDPITYNMDPIQLEKALAALTGDHQGYPLPQSLTMEELKPKAIIPVDLFGLSADYDAINAIAKKYNLVVLEDAAQSFGALYKGRRTCGLTKIAATSFFPAKPLGCCGDGGAVFTNDDALLENLLSIRIHGQSDDKYNNVRVGLNARMDTIQAAVILAKLPIFEAEIAKRQVVAQSYNTRLRDLADCKTPLVPSGYLSVWAQYSIMSSKKDVIMTALKNAEIPTACYYPIPLHLQGAFSYLGYQNGDMPYSETCARNIFSLPMHPYLKENDIERICSVITNALR